MSKVEVKGAGPSMSALAGMGVFGTDGAERPLGHAWAEKTAVIVFVRHFG